MTDTTTAASGSPRSRASSSIRTVPNTPIWREAVDALDPGVLAERLAFAERDLLADGGFIDLLVADHDDRSDDHLHARVHAHHDGDVHGPVLLAEHGRGDVHRGRPEPEAAQVILDGDSILPEDLRHVRAASMQPHQSDRPPRLRAHRRSTPPAAPPGWTRPDDAAPPPPPG